MMVVVQVVVLVLILALVVVVLVEVVGVGAVVGCGKRGGGRIELTCRHRRRTRRAIRGRLAPDYR